MNRSLLHYDRIRKLWTAAKVVGILLLGGIFGLIAVLSTAKVYKQSLIDRARTATQGVGVYQLEQLQGDEHDVNLPSYQIVKTQLTNLHKLNRDSRFVYVMGMNNKGEVFFNADSEPADSEDYSPPGQTFDEASPALKALFTNKQDLVEGPIRDRWGVWLSALTPIYDPQSHKMVGVLGIDVPAKAYLTLLAIVAAFPVSIAIIAALIIGIVDVTRRRNQENVEMQAELVSTITHELNNPLTGIRWGAELLMSTYVKEGPGQGVVKAIYSSVRKLQESVDDVLEIARLGRGATQLNLQDVDIRAIVEEVFVTQKLPAEHKKVTMALTENWPDHVQVYCDESKMKRVFNNLISNAIKYTTENTQVVVDYTHGNGVHQVSIKDQGIGIPKDEQEKVFAGFYRASNALKSGERGTGMGLFLVRKTIQQHGGDISLDSEEGKGTTVMFKIRDDLGTAETK